MCYPLVCTVCKKPYEGLREEYRCTHCGGSIESPVAASPDREDLKEAIRKGSFDGIWGYRPFLPVDDDVELLTLGEGNTPLLRAARLGGEIGLVNLMLKNETVNPSGTYKDRFAAVAISLEKHAGTRAVALGSAGNAAAAVSAYSAIAGIPCFVLLPPGAVQERVWQNQSYGARFIRVKSGGINDCIDMVTRGEKEFGWKNVSTTMRHHPRGAEGYKTIAYEIVRQLNFEIPDYVICPVGGAILISKVYRGFTELLDLGLIDRIPKMIAAQAEGCAPLVKAFKEGAEKTDFWENANTIAFAINDPVVFEGVTGLDVLRRSGGFAESVSDREIVEAMRLCARTEAVLAEPASAAVLALARKLAADGRLKKTDRVLCVVSGSALRDLKLLADEQPPAPHVRLEVEGIREAFEFYGGMPKVCDTASR